MASTALWWIGNAVLLVVVLPIIVMLIRRINAAVGRIKVTVDDILQNGVALTGELDNVPEALAVTDSTVGEVAIGANRYVDRVAGLLG